MSLDFSIKPVGAPVAPSAAPPVSHAADHAVATELPPSRSVTAADAGARARADASANASVSRQVVIDLAAASIVYQVVDARTSLVVSQYPEESVLRRRAYFHSLDLAKSEPTRTLATDRTA